MSKFSPPSGSKLPPLKLSREIQIEDCRIEFGKRVANHDSPVVVGIHTRARFVDRGSDVM
jgi:hypothetical protein